MGDANYLKIGTISILLTIIGILGLVICSTVLPQITSFFAIMANVGESLGIIYLIDRYVLKDINTLELIKNGGGVSYSIFLLAICLVIAASIIGS